MSIPDYYLNYARVLGISAWWIGAAMWAMAPVGRTQFSISQNQIADFTGLGRSTINEIFAGPKGEDAALGWLIERPDAQTDRERGARRGIPNLFRWRCGLPFTPGQQEAVIRMLGERFLDERSRKHALTSRDAGQILNRMLQTPGPELRAGLGTRHVGIQPSRPMTMIQIVSTAAVTQLQEDGELAEPLHRLWRALRPDMTVNIPDVIRAGWIPEIGRAAVWIYLLAVARTIGQRDREWVLSNGLNELIDLIGANRSSTLRWIGLLETNGFLKRLTPLSATAEVAFQVVDPEAAPMTEAQRITLALVPASPTETPAAGDSARCNTGQVWVSEADTSPKGGQVSVSEVDVSLRSGQGSDNPPNPGPIFGQVSGAETDRPKRPENAGETEITAPEASNRPNSGREEEEDKSIKTIQVAGWMGTLDLIRWCGVSIAPKHEDLLGHTNPAVYVARVLEQSPTDLAFVNAYKRLVATPANAPRSGLRQPYAGLVRLRPHVLALLVHWVRTQSAAAETLLGSDELLELGRDLLTDLTKRHVGAVEKMGDHLRNVANGLVNSEGYSLTEMAAVLCREWQAQRRQDVAAPAAADEHEAEVDSTPADDVESVLLPKVGLIPSDDVPETDRLWRQVLDNLRMELPGPTFDQWLRPTRAIAIDGHTIRVAAPTEYSCFWIQTRQLGAVMRTLETLKGERYEVQLVVDKKGPRHLDVSVDKV